MKDDFDFDIPELNRIGSMMDDLIPTERPGQNESRPTSRSSPRRWRTRARRFTSYSLSSFSDGVNWKNAATFRSSLTMDTSSTRTRIGAVSLAKYSESVNWKNALDGPQLVLVASNGAADSAGPPETLDDFFGSSTWE
ncbi:MAG: hypothetical protein U0798_12765 [Gemmataceae bacterium]